MFINKYRYNSFFLSTVLTGQYNNQNKKLNKNISIHNTHELPDAYLMTEKLTLSLLFPASSVIMT